MLVDEFASAPAHSGLRRRTLKSAKQSMIVSTWQFLQKQVRGVSLGRAVKRVKLLAARKSNFHRDIFGADPKNINTRAGIGEVAPISAHRFRLPVVLSRNAVTPCATKDI